MALIYAISISQAHAAVKKGEAALIVSVSAGNGHTMALDDKGQLWAWGNNYYGQVGDGNISTYHDPIYDDESDDEFQEIVNGRVRNIDNDVYKPKLIMNNVRAIYARNNSSFAITNDNKLYAWGYNAEGQLGDGTAANKSKPAFIMDSVLDIESRWSRTFITKTDGTLWIAGIKFGAQHNDGTEPTLLYSNVKKAVYDGATNSNGGLLVLTNDNKVISYMPKDRSIGEYIFFEWKQFSDIVDISSAFQQVYVLTKSGDVFGWGPGSELGIEVNEFWVHSPAFIASKIKRILKGHIFIRNDDALLIWGTVPEVEDYMNSDGTDGGGSLIGDLIVYGKTPGSILKNIKMAEKGESHFIAVGKDGNVYTWGDNFYGQLGDGSNKKRTVPKRIVFP